MVYALRVCGIPRSAGKGTESVPVASSSIFARTRSCPRSEVTGHLKPVQFAIAKRK